MYNKIRTIAVVGSRSLIGYNEPIEFMINFLSGYYSRLGFRVVFITGDARGVDYYVADACKKNGVECRIYKARRYSVKYTPAHFHARNDCLIIDADEVHAVWDGRSRGTYSVIQKARKLKKPVYVYIFSRLLKSEYELFTT